jgi:hypothetical protein
MYSIVVLVCAWLGANALKEGFEVNQIIVNPALPNDKIMAQTCNVFSCDFSAPFVPPPSPPPPTQPVSEPIAPQPSCPTEVSLEEIREYDLYTPEEEAMEERIAEKQQQYNEIEQKVQILESSYQEKQKAMEEAMRMRQDSIRQTEMAELQRKNASNPTQDFMGDISKNLFKIANKLGIPLI